MSEARALAMARPRLAAARPRWPARAVVPVLGLGLLGGFALLSARDPAL
jgi:hypothetical protein